MKQQTERNRKDQSSERAKILRSAIQNLKKNKVSQNEFNRIPVRKMSNEFHSNNEYKENKQVNQQNALFQSDVERFKSDTSILSDYIKHHRKVKTLDKMTNGNKISGVDMKKNDEDFGDAKLPFTQNIENTKITKGIILPRVNPTDLENYGYEIPILNADHVVQESKRELQQQDFNDEICFEQEREIDLFLREIGHEILIRKSDENANNEVGILEDKSELINEYVPQFKSDLDSREGCENLESDHFLQILAVNKSETLTETSAKKFVNEDIDTHAQIEKKNDLNFIKENIFTSIDEKSQVIVNTNSFTGNLTDFVNISTLDENTNCARNNKNEYDKLIIFENQTNKLPKLASKKNDFENIYTFFNDERKDKQAMNFRRSSSWDENVMEESLGCDISCEQTKVENSKGKKQHACYNQSQPISSRISKNDSEKAEEDFSLDKSEKVSCVEGNNNESPPVALKSKTQFSSLKLSPPPTSLKFGVNFCSHKAEKSKLYPPLQLRAVNRKLSTIQEQEFGCIFSSKKPLFDFQTTLREEGTGCISKEDEGDSSTDDSESESLNEYKFTENETVKEYEFFDENEPMKEYMFSEENETIIEQKNKCDLSSDGLIKEFKTIQIKPILKKVDTKPSETCQEMVKKKIKFSDEVEFLCAIREGDYNSVVDLSDKVNNMRSGTARGSTPLHIATQHGHIEIVKYLVEKYLDVNAQDSRGLTPLHLASSNNDINCIEYLLENGANPFVFSEYYECFPVMLLVNDASGVAECLNLFRNYIEDLGVVNNATCFPTWNNPANDKDDLPLYKMRPIKILNKETGLMEGAKWFAEDENMRKGYVPWHYLTIHPTKKYQDKKINK